MEDLKKKIENAAAAAEDLPEVPRDENGKIIIEAVAIGQDDKGRYIVPDNIFNTYIKELPPGTGNESKTFRAYNGGKLAQLENDPEEASRRGIVGAMASNATQATRRSCKEILEELARMPADPETLDRLGLAEGTNNLEAATFAQYRKAQQGDTKAMEYIRDTVGEKPTEKIDASIDCDPESLKMVERVAARMKSEG